MSTSIDLSYPAIKKLFAKHFVTGRTESRAFLAWFLENYYRLDDFNSQDAICDGPDDKGIDAIYVYDSLEAIDVFQCKLYQNNSKTLGETALRDFVGTLSQFQDANFIDIMASNTANIELAGLLREQEVAEKVRQGYSVRGVFLTNASRDTSADQYLKGHPGLQVFDAPTLQKLYVSPFPSRPSTNSITFDLTEGRYLYDIIEDVEYVMAHIKASDLIQMEGIADQSLFDWNVRQSLGRTDVNKDIEKSVKHKEEHRHFVLYHNGLTILCEDLSFQGHQLNIRGYSVVNGCQSLTTIYQNQSHISHDLVILTRIIQVAPDSELATKITNHTNNQNGIKARDLQSNSNIQRRLQNEFIGLWPDIFYKIKRGEKTTKLQEIDNELAARLLLAFDIKEPWTCHQSYKLFDELHTRIFNRPEVSADRIVAINDIFSVVLDRLQRVDNKLLATYTLTKFFLLYLIREAIEADDTGRQFCQNPSIYIRAKDGRSRIMKCIGTILDELIIELNYHTKQLETAGTPFDYKRDLKSPKAVGSLASQIIPQYQRLVSRGRVDSFTNDWKKSENIEP